MAKTTMRHFDDKTSYLKKVKCSGEHKDINHVIVNRSCKLQGSKFSIGHLGKLTNKIVYEV